MIRRRKYISPPQVQHRLRPDHKKNPNILVGYCSANKSEREKNTYGSQEL